MSDDTAGIPMARPNLFLLVLAWTAPAFADEQLRFDSSDLAFHPAVSDTEVVATFPFVNSGASTVTIVEVKTSCGCTTANLPKKVFAPGERGDIGATFTIGDRTGLQIKTIKVTTDVPGMPVMSLTMKVQLPDGPSFSQRFIQWESGADPAPKSVSISIPPNSEYVLTGFEFRDARIIPTLEVVEAHHQYRVAIRLADASMPFNGNVDVHTNFRTFHLFVRVNPAIQH